MRNKAILYPAIIIFLLVMLTGCGGSSAGGGAVSSIEEVRSAVIQIEAQGSFIDPEVGMVYNAAGRGSGFIIDPTGIAVTNNHVVTGSALLQVWVEGYDKPLNARILGVSECSDLAVIDIEGDGFPYLEWYEGDIKVGMDVYAAGYPLGDPEFTLTRGIISKSSSDGDTSWSSVDHVVMHDATINPGNSGGPLITAEGMLVGINYMGSKQVDQYFAISRDEALRVIEILRGGKDDLSIGINGMAVVAEDLSGIWVSSVKSGSAADLAGIEAGDVILTLEDLILSTDGTMADYCDILRTHDAGDTLNVEVLRYVDEQILRGQINGRQLAPEQVLAQPTQAPAAQPTQAPAATSPPSSGAVSSSGGGSCTNGTLSAGYTCLKGPDDSVVLPVPVSWTDTADGYWETETSTVGIRMLAAPDMEAFLDFSGVGAMLYASKLYDVIGGAETWADNMGNFYEEEWNCTAVGNETIETHTWVGVWDTYTNCNSQTTFMALFTMESKTQPGEAVAQLTFNYTGEADIEILAEMLMGLEIIGQLP